MLHTGENKEKMIIYGKSINQKIIIICHGGRPLLSDSPEGATLSLRKWPL